MEKAINSLVPEGLRQKKKKKAEKQGKREGERMSREISDRGRDDGAQKTSQKKKKCVQTFSVSSWIWRNEDKLHGYLTWRIQQWSSAFGNLSLFLFYPKKYETKWNSCSLFCHYQKSWALFGVKYSLYSVFCSRLNPIIFQHRLIFFFFREVNVYPVYWETVFKATWKTSWKCRLLHFLYLFRWFQRDSEQRSSVEALNLSGCWESWRNSHQSSSKGWLNPGQFSLFTLSFTPLVIVV